jgi:hypothetical protein
VGRWSCTGGVEGWLAPSVKKRAKYLEDGVRTSGVVAPGVCAAARKEKRIRGGTEVEVEKQVSPLRRQKRRLRSK